MEVQAFVFHANDDDLYRVGRTVRSLNAAGIEAREIAEPGGRTFRKILAAEQPILFVRAGLWLVNGEEYATPLSSSAGKPLCAFGAVRSHPKSDSTANSLVDAWTDILRQTGGDFSRLSDALTSLKPFFEAPAILFLDAKACATLREAGASSLAEGAHIACKQFRLVHCPPLDVYSGRAVRVLQVITALQRGGAERITLDLVSELPSCGSAVQLATLGRPPREPFPAPNGTIDCGGLATDGEDRLTVLQRKATAFGADVIHAHLLAGAEVRALTSAGFPVLLTLHNTREGWASGISELRERDAALLVACSAAVESEARRSALSFMFLIVVLG